jgi:hypothetical protein
MVQVQDCAFAGPVQLWWAAQAVGVPSDRHPLAPTVHAATPLFPMQDV